MVEIVPPRFAVGHEKRFADFISGLNDADTIALVSHNDLDGLGSAKIVNEAVDADFVYLLNYEDVNENLIQVLREKNVTKLIITDLSMDDIAFIKEASKHFEILWIDHHVIMEDVNSDRIVFLNSSGASQHCATYLAYYLFSKITDLSKYDWLVAAACLSDFTLKDNMDWMKQIFEKYGDTTEIVPMSFEEGKIQNVKRDLEFAIIYFKTEEKLKFILDSITPETIEENTLKEHSDVVKAEIDTWIAAFDSEKEVIGDIYLFLFTPKFGIGSYVSSLLSVQNPHNTLVIMRPKDDYYAVSMRRQDRGADMNQLMKKVLHGMEGAAGGGHVPAAGGRFLQKDLALFKKRLETA